MNACVASFRQRLFIQAAITGIFALLPSNSGQSSWLTITLVLAVASAAVAACLPSLGGAAYQTALGFEVVAVAVGAYALTQNTYIPGTIVGIAALIRLFDANVKAAFAAGAGAPARPAAYNPQQYQAPQQFTGQFGNPQFGAPQYAPPAQQPQYAPPAPQPYGAPQYAPPQQYGSPQNAPSPVPPPPPVGSWPPPPPPA